MSEDIFKETLQYILSKCKNTFDKDVIIQMPEDEELFRRVLFPLTSHGYLNGFTLIDDGVRNGIEISQVVVNVSRKSKVFIE